LLTQKKAGSSDAATRHTRRLRLPPTQRPRADDDPAHWMPGIGIGAGVDRTLNARHRRA
jgi:hypothetical protein